MGSNKVVRVLHVFNRMARGGAEMRTLDVMRKVDRDRFQFNFCTLSGQAGTLDDEIRELGGDIFSCPLGLSFPWRFRQLLREQRFDVVHSHAHTFSGLIVRLAAQENTPMRIVHFRSSQDGHRSSLRRRLQRYIMKRWIDAYATDILAVSKGVISTVWNNNWQSDIRCRVLYNGIDTSAFSVVEERDDILEGLGIPVDSKICVHIGRTAVPKNHVRLISIFAELLKLEPDARLLLVGRTDNNIGRIVKEKISQLGITESVTFAGERKDVPQLLRASNVLIFPSLWEGLPGAVLESCAAGTPVLASDVPGVVEIASYIPHVNFMSLEKSDAEWAARARELLDTSGDIREEMIAAINRSVFLISSCVNEYNKLYGRIN